MVYAIVEFAKRFERASGRADVGGIAFAFAIQERTTLPSVDNTELLIHALLRFGSNGTGFSLPACWSDACDNGSL